MSQTSLSQVYRILIPQVAFQLTFSSIAASAVQPSQVDLCSPHAQDALSHPPLGAPTL